MKMPSLISTIYILIGLLMKIEISYSKFEFLRRDHAYKNEIFEKNNQSISQNKENLHHYLPIFNFSEEYVAPNRTYQFLELYKEISTIKSANSVSLKKAYVDQVLIPKTDAKVAKLKAETAYIETKNAAKKKKMSQVKGDLEKNITFSSLIGNLLNSSSQINSTQILNNIYNETFYYLNNKNMSNSTEEIVYELA
ncbi:putative Secreted Protein [Cryptosporidium tyzzeri]|nr:putative Secreted Protein [Cryptosporidium tyzzeri]